MSGADDVRVSRFCVEDRVEVVGGKLAEFFSALERALPRIERAGARCLGAFHTAGPTGRWNEAFVYWDIEGWEAYAAVLRELGGPGSLCDAADPDWTLRMGGSSLTLHPTRHCPRLADLVEAGVRGRVFLHEYIQVLPGQRLAYVEHYVNNYLEATRKAGRELVGIWGLQKSANDVLILLAIPDWETHASALAHMPDAYAEKPWRSSAPQLRADYDLRMLVAGPQALNPLAL